MTVQPSTLEQRNKDLFHRWFGQVWNAGNYEVAQQVISPTMRVHGAGDNRSRWGRTACRGWCARGVTPSPTAR